MWTRANRARYNRDQLRYPSDTTEEEWTAARPPDSPCETGRTQADGEYP